MIGERGMSGILITLNGNQAVGKVDLGSTINHYQGNQLGKEISDARHR